MFTKQRQNLKFYKKIKQFFLLFLTLIQASFLFLSISPLISKNAIADSLLCTYSANDGSPRGANSISISTSSIKDSEGNQIGIQGSIQVIYEAGNAQGIDYNNSLVACSADNLAPYITLIEQNTIRDNQTVSSEFRLQNVAVNSAKTKEGANTLSVKGDFSIPNLASSGLNINNLQSYTKIPASNVRTVYLNYSTREGSGSTGITKSPFLSTGRDTYDANRTVNLYVCKNGTLICADVNSGSGGPSGDPTTTNDLQIKLGSLKLGVRPSVSGVSKSMTPDPKKAFIRTYIDENGKIAGFSLDAFIIPAAPPDKTLYIKDGSNNSSVIIGDPTNLAFSPKKVLNLGAQIFNKDILFDSANKYGCIKNDFSTNYVIGNETVVFNFCNPAVKDIVNNQLHVKTDGSAGQNFTLALNDTLLKGLLASNQVKCTDPKTGEGCDETLNKIQIAPLLSIEKAPTADTTWTSFFSKLPQVVGQYLLDSGSVPLTYTPADFYIEIYPSKAAFDKHINDPPPAAVPDIQDVVSTAQAGTQSTAQTLYAFIVRIISSIVVWLQSIIYRIFAYIVVPILKALLSVRPYQDVFVNIIYPGWLILRNLANIFFILSLLVVGLRILFQQSASGAARGFIIRLVLMALLVNFSLVIAQGIVAVADTVQSQFLPANSRVIEALGAKLMVEPLKNFNEEVDNKTSITNLNADQSQLALADTVKPLVLLILSVASFFSFLAIAAFLLVRLVALWVLYMTSPIAYVGLVMGETSSYAKQWWNEFIHYVIMTPVLVFFLNIAALMAIAFSGSNDTLFKFNQDNTLSGDVVIGTLTILTHFIVLAVIYAGMKYASKMGGAAGKTIVKYAQKGFQNTFKKPYQWGKAAAMPTKDFVGDKASVGMGKLFGSRAENVTQALFKPKDALSSLKRGMLDRPGEDRKKREKKRLGTIDDQAYKIMNNKWKAAKYAASTLAGNGPKFAYGQGSAKVDESQILTDKEWQAAQNDLTKNKTAFDAANGRKEDFYKGLVDESDIDKSLGALQETKSKLEAERNDAIAANDNEQVQKITNRIDKIDRLTNELNGAKNGAVNGKIDFRNFQDSIPDDLQVEASAVFDPNQINMEINKAVKDAEAEKSRLEGLIQQNDERRKKFGYGDADPAAVGHRAMIIAERVSLSDQGNKEMADAQKRFLAPSLAEREARVSGEREQAKKIDEIDDPEELSAQFEGAMKKNNMALATAIAKKMAKEGNFDKLLSANGYENNLKSFQAFMEKHFKDMAPQIRMQIASEIGSIAAQNGNTTFVKPTKVDQGVMRWSTEQEHLAAKQSKIQSASSYDLAKKKLYEISYQQNGKSYLEKGAIDNFNSMTPEKLRKYIERKSPKELEDLKKFENYSLLMPGVQQLLESKR